MRLLDRYRSVRNESRILCEPLAVEDMVVQSMPDVSPTKWHLAHTSWFFETFVLSPLGDPLFDPSYKALFNSYYNSLGAPFPRERRGLVTRPTVEEVWGYRAHVDKRIAHHLGGGVDAATLRVVEVGLQHEQQHQELMLTDIKHVLWHSPALPGITPTIADPVDPVPLEWSAHEGAVVEIGFSGTGFSFDNEHPRHRHLVQPHMLANRLVTCGEFQAFIDDGGYDDHALWLSEGWAWVQQGRVRAPLYWLDDGTIYTLAGRRERRASEPVVHVSFYEADAFARWAGHRLPTEQELELALTAVPVTGHFADSREFHPRPASGRGMTQCFGDGWAWTQSAYAPYPGYRPPPGAIGEYNGKFMCNQHVLRGGSCATPAGHARASYRNFFPAHARWQFSVIRLASDGSRG